jgi:hypothetical protein
MKESLAVPNLWTKNRVTRKPTEMEEMLLFRLGTDSPIPATADVTETAGVSIPSATVRAVPNSACVPRKEQLNMMLFVVRGEHEPNRGAAT